MLVLLEEAGSPVACVARPWDRLWARLCAFRLDSDLAAGASPEASVALALRAQMLVRTRHRRDLAAAVNRVLALATLPSGPSRPRVPVCRDRVRECSGEFDALIRRLRAPGPVPAQGMAMVRVLLTDAGGPLYHRPNAGDLRAQVRDAADALIAV
jgi:hypothetical protein